jgi:hypothetical protein
LDHDAVGLISLAGPVSGSSDEKVAGALFTIRDCDASAADGRKLPMASRRIAPTAEADALVLTLRIGV